MNLKDRLANLYGPQSSTHLRNRLEKLRNSRDPRTLAGSLGGQVKSIGDGHIVTVSRQYDLRHYHGKSSLEGLKHFPSTHFCRLCGIRTEDFSPRQIIFLDTETTGLSGGAGTYVFLIGVGYIRDDRFQLYQIFLHDFVAEPHLLEELIAVADPELDQFRHLVTFNGKNYDLNLLATRFLLHRKENPFSDFHHLDLLYPSRVLWKHSLPDCSLQTLEQRVLGYERTADIPSPLIPSIYFRYLRGNNTHQSFEKIFRHNRLDILSLALLLVELGTALDTVSPPPTIDPLRAAHLLTLRGRTSDAIDLLATALHHGHRRTEIQTQIGLLYKKQGEFPAALETFLLLIRNSKSPPLLCYEEAAKILEHHEGDLVRALNVVEQAMENYPASSELTHRKHRLLSRIARKKWY